jgi:hypothetical protein
MYQERKNPKVTFSREAEKAEINNHPATLIVRAPLAPFLWWKTIFESVSDTDLTIKQSKVRRYLLFLLASAVLMVIVAGVGFAANAHSTG